MAATKVIIFNTIESLMIRKMKYETFNKLVTVFPKFFTKYIPSFEQREYEFKFNKFKSELEEFKEVYMLESNRNPNKETLIDNQIKLITNSYKEGREYKNESVRKLTLAARVITGVVDVAEQWVGVQAIRGPIGLVYTLRYNDEGGNGLDAPPIKLSLKVLSSAVEAASRRLQAGWTIEAMRDMSNVHGLDIESEMIKALSSGIIHEIENELISDLTRLAEKSEIIKIDFKSSEDKSSFIGDRFMHIKPYINDACNDIARKTRRGAGNFIVVSPVMVSVLQSAGKAVFAPAVAGSFKGPNNTMLVGTLDGTIKVYSHIGGGTDKNIERILIGYKGGSSDTDAGYIYAPYILPMESGIIVNPETFQPEVHHMVRYGKHVDDVSHNYYRVIDVDLTNICNKSKSDTADNEINVMVEE